MIFSIKDLRFILGAINSKLNILKAEKVFSGDRKELDKCVDRDSDIQHYKRLRSEIESQINTHETKFDEPLTVEPV